MFIDVEPHTVSDSYYYKSQNTYIWCKVQAWMWLLTIFWHFLKFIG